MDKHLLASAAALLLSTVAFSQNIAWRRVTGGFIDFGLVADSFDHLRMLNSFSGTHDFDPGPGESLISVQGPPAFCTAIVPQRRRFPLGTAARWTQHRLHDYYAGD
ncbi:MAG: hypothetical protein IPM98_00680 [Lewinellaceae bacterium]|nr:hypothetical protein [Lewinellaceae bacterium]